MNGIALLGITDSIQHALFGNTFEDIGLILFGFKIVVLLFIISFVRNRLGGGPISILAIAALGYIILFQQWNIFGPVMFIYLFIVFGFSMIVFDLSIAKPWRGGGGGAEGTESKSYEHAQNRARQRGMMH